VTIPQPILRCFRRFDAHEYIWPQRGHTCSRGLTIGKRGASGKRPSVRERDHERPPRGSGLVPGWRRASREGPLSPPLPSDSLPRVEGVGRSQGSKRRNATKVISINIEAHALSKSGMDPPQSHPRDNPSSETALFEHRARQLFSLSRIRNASREDTSGSSRSERWSYVVDKFGLSKIRNRVRPVVSKSASSISRKNINTRATVFLCNVLTSSVLVLLDTFNTPETK